MHRLTMTTGAGYWRLLAAAWSGLLLHSMVLASADSATPTRLRVEPDGQSEEVVVYGPDFFAVYNPVNARDMIDQLPGFQLVNGGGGRGFGGSAGNLLINGERPSSKQDRPSEILARIPVARVERIELIRGDTGSLSAGGQTVVANVVLRDSGPPSWTWTTELEQDTDSGGPEPGGSLSVLGTAGDTRYAAGIEARHFFFGNSATEGLTADQRLVELRDMTDASQGNEYAASLNTETRFGERVARFNAKLEYLGSGFRERSVGVRANPSISPFRVDRDQTRRDYELELGGDLQWQTDSQTDFKAIVVINRQWRDRAAGLRSEDPDEPVMRQRAVTDSRSAESIARLELDWFGWDRHYLEANLETALNVLDNQLALHVDSGDGFRPVLVPGGTARVEEWRSELQLTDSWQIDQWTLEPGLGSEFSQISQTGPGGQARSFFFFKPSLAVIHAPSNAHQTRINLRRDVAQLNFGDFVSATDFGDEEIDLGNPDLVPQNTWVAELAHERRFGRIGNATLRVFFNRISDLQDILPVTADQGVPGNIGDGRRWGIALETTLPMEPLGFRNARMDMDLRWQDSRVEDPVTGVDRPFSGESAFRVNTELRQELTAIQSAWGLSASYRDETIRYDVDELDIRSDGVDLELFIETTRFRRIKMRLEAENLLDRRFERDRRLFDISRIDPRPAFRELRDFRRGRSLILSLSGGF